MKPTHFELILYTKQHNHYRTTQTLLCSSKHNKLRRNVSLINDVCVHAPSVAADLLPTLPPSITRYQTIIDRIQQRWCDNPHASIDKHVSQDAPDLQRPRKTCEQDLCLSSRSCVPRDYSKVRTKCAPPICSERAVRSICIELPRGVTRLFRK